MRPYLFFSFFLKWPGNIINDFVKKKAKTGFLRGGFRLLNHYFVLRCLFLAA